MDKKRVIFDLTIAGVTLVTVYAVTKIAEKKKNYTEVSTPKYATANNEPEKKEEEPKEKIKATAEKVADKVVKGYEKTMKFVMKHKDEIDTITSAVSLFAAIYTLKDARRKLKTPTGNELHKKSLPNGSTYVGSNSDDIVKFVDTLSTGDGGYIKLDKWDGKKQLIYMTMDLEKGGEAA